MERRLTLVLFTLSLTITFASGTNLDQTLKTHSNFDQGVDHNNNHDESSILLGSDSETVDVNEFIIGVIENFRDEMKTGIPELKIPILDPLKAKKPAKVDVEDSKAVVHANFYNIYVAGLSGFILKELNADLRNLSLLFDLEIPNLRATGNYTLDGKIVKIIPLRGNGSFWVESKNLSLAAKASIKKSDDDKHFQLSDDFNVSIDFDKTEIYLENFLGGGRWTDVLMKIVGDVSKDLFRKFLPHLKDEVNDALLKVINKRLSKLPITSIIPGGSTADDYIDEILHNVKLYIEKNEMDPMDLPDYVYNFTKEIMYITFEGEAKLYDGRMYGISTIHRTDECELEANRTTISVSAHLGLNDLKLSYKGHAKFMSWGPSIEAGGNLEKVAFYFKIEQSNRKGATPILREFEIVEMSTIWIELSGLGPLTWIMKWMLTGISKLVEDFVVEKMTEYIKEFMQNEFNKLSFPV